MPPSETSHVYFFILNQHTKKMLKSAHLPNGTPSSLIFKILNGFQTVVTFRNIYASLAEPDPFIVPCADKHRHNTMVVVRESHKGCLKSPLDTNSKTAYRSMYSITPHTRRCTNVSLFYWNRTRVHVIIYRPIENTVYVCMHICSVCDVYLCVMYT